MLLLIVTLLNRCARKSLKTHSSFCLQQEACPRFLKFNLKSSLQLIFITCLLLKNELKVLFFNITRFMIKFFKYTHNFFFNYLVFRR